ncbi:MAG: hypothetical protein U0325_07020 [Polyangiales bacterium]
MRRLGPILVVLSACSLEHPVARFDAGVRPDAVTADTSAADDVVDAGGLADAPDALEPVDVAPDALEPVDAQDVLEPVDAQDVPEPVDALDVPEPVDALDVPEPVDAADAGALDAGSADAPDVVVAVDAADAGSPADVRDVPPAIDVVDAPAAPDVVDVPVVRDVPTAPDVITRTYTLVPGDTQVTARQGNSNGDNRSLRCNSGEVLVGLSIRASSYVSGFASRCASLRSDGTTGAVRETSYQGGTVWGDRTTNDCPAGSMVVGLAGRAGGIIDRIAVQCASLASWIPGRTLTATLPNRGGNGGSDFTAQCPAGYIGLGVDFDTTFYAADFRASRLSLVCVRVNRTPP